MPSSLTRRNKSFRLFGRSLRIALFPLNGIPWAAGMLCILGAALVGFYTKTVKFTWMFDLYDLTLTTPCTIMFYYGVLLGVTTSSGCFASSGGRWWSTALYCFLLIMLALFDYYWGIRIFFKTTSLMDFLDSIESTMDQYTVPNATFGIYPRQVKEYWDHIQQQNHCCGMYTWKDWIETPLGKTLNFPSSCCNENYGTADCGNNLGKHPDSADHQVMDIIHTKGCMRVYPRRFIWAFLEASVLGIALGIVLLLSFLLSLILFFIVICCCYRPGKPITDPVSEESRRNSSGGGSRRHHHRHSRPHAHTPTEVLTDSAAEPGGTNPVTYDQFGRRRISIPPGEFEMEINQEPKRDLELIV